MSIKQKKILLRIKRSIILLSFITISLLAARTQPRSTVEIIGHISPDPVIGQTVTLSVEMMTPYDAEEALLNIVLPEGIRHMGGELSWEGSLIENTPIHHEISICVLYPIDKSIYLSGGSSKDATGVKLFIISNYDSAEVVPGSKYRYVQPSIDSTPTPTPSPATVAQECLDKN